MAELEQFTPDPLIPTAAVVYCEALNQRGGFGADRRPTCARRVGPLVAGQTNPKVLAQLARGRMRAKIGVLEEAFTGHFTDHHAFLLGAMLARIDALDA
ncbi:MAG: hypothetical protein ACRDRO_02090, partial [Pseudonocardiaceae bacterium]